MKKTFSFLNRAIFILNSIFALGLILGYLLPYIPPKSFPLLAVGALFVPVLIIANLIFALYWLLKLRKQVWLSLIVLALGLFQNRTLLAWGSKPNSDIGNLSIMSYNVKGFRYNSPQSPVKNRENALNFINKKSPDIICLQEYLGKEEPLVSKLNTHYFFYNGMKKNGRGAILSKYKIIGYGDLKFPDTYNAGLYIDIIKEKDTIRIYSLHMQSLSIQTDIEELSKDDKRILYRTIRKAFIKQHEQLDIFLENEKKCSYKKIVVGDFNNTVFSYIYRKIKGDRKDAFAEVGKGFGNTFNLDFIPLRIDFILPDPAIEVIGFDRYELDYSDHFPILSYLKV